MVLSRQPGAVACLTIAAVALALSEPARAQVASTTHGAGSPSDIDEVVVTARRVKENLQSVPVAVTALNAVQIRERGVTSIESLSQLTPGVILTHVGTNSNNVFTIRGQSRAPAEVGLSAVITYFNEVPLPTIGSAIPAFDMDNLQVLKGPQGTLFGRNTTGGAILAYSRRPAFEYGGYLEGRYTSFEGKYLEGAANIPVVDDVLAVRLAAQSRRRDGYTKNMTGGGDFDDIDEASYRASVLFQPSSNFSNFTVLDYYNSETTGAGISITETLPGYGFLVNGIRALFEQGGGLAPGTLESYFNSTFLCGVSPSCDGFLAAARAVAHPHQEWPTAGIPLNERVKRYGLSNTTTLNLSDDLTVKNILGWRKTSYSAALDAEGAEFPMVSAYLADNVEALSDEIQLSGRSFDTRLNWLLGLYYLKERPPGSPVSALGFFAPLMPGVTAGSQNFHRTTSKAAYLSLGYDLSEVLSGLRANGAIRYTSDRSSLCTQPAVLGNPYNAGLVDDDQCRSNIINFQARARSHATTYTIGLDYRLNDDLFFYITSRRGYRAGGINSPHLAEPGPGVTRPLSEFQQYQPEFVTDVELGAKTDWRYAGWSGRFNIAAYRSNYRSIQRPVVLPSNYDGDGNSANDPVNFSLTLNGGRAVIKGIEVETIIRPTRRLSVNLAAAYTSARFVSFASPLAGATAADPIFYATPRWSASANVRYALPMDPSHGELVVNADYYYVAHQFYQDLRAPGYATVALRLDWNNVEASPVDIGLYVENVFDRVYIATTQLTSTSTQMFGAGYGPPRIYGVRLRYRFGGG